MYKHMVFNSKAWWNKYTDCVNDWGPSSLVLPENWLKLQELAEFFWYNSLLRKIFSWIVMYLYLQTLLSGADEVGAYIIVANHCNSWWRWWWWSDHFMSNSSQVFLDLHFNSCYHFVPSVVMEFNLPLNVMLNLQSVDAKNSISCFLGNVCCGEVNPEAPWSKKCHHRNSWKSVQDVYLQPGTNSYRNSQLITISYI